MQARAVHHFRQKTVRSSSDRETVMLGLQSLGRVWTPRSVCCSAVKPTIGLIPLAPPPLRPSPRAPLHSLQPTRGGELPIFPLASAPGSGRKKAAAAEQDLRGSEQRVADLKVALAEARKTEAGVRAGAEAAAFEADQALREVGRLFRVRGRGGVDDGGDVNHGVGGHDVGYSFLLRAAYLFSWKVLRHDTDRHDAHKRLWLNQRTSRSSNPSTPCTKLDRNIGVATKVVDRTFCFWEAEKEWGGGFREGERLRGTEPPPPNSFPVWYIFSS